MPGRQSALLAPGPDVLHQGFEGGIEEAAVALEVFHRPPRAARLEAEKEPVLELRVRIVSGAPADGREAVLHLVAVVESRGGVDPAGIPGVKVGDPADAAVDVERGALLPLPLGPQGQGDVRSTGNGLVRGINLARGPLQHGGDAGFRVASLAEGDARPHPLSTDGIGHEDGEVAVLGRHLGDALAAVGDVEDVEFEEGAFVEEAGFAGQGSGQCGKRR